MRITESKLRSVIRGVLRESYEDKKAYIREVQQLLLGAGVSVNSSEMHDEFTVNVTGMQREEVVPESGINTCFLKKHSPEACADFILEWIRSKGGIVGMLKKKMISRRDYVRGSQGEIDWSATAKKIGLPDGASIKDIKRYTR